jgi:cell division protein FtsW
MTAIATPPVRRKGATPSSPTHVPVLHRPLASYYLLLVSTCLLLVIGLVMVLSASFVRSYATYGSPYVIFAKQASFVVVGLVGLWFASRIPAKTWRLMAVPLIIASLVLLVLVLVPGIGKNVDGARRWIPLPGGVNLQPTEIAKLALCLWGADVLVRKRKLLGEWKHLMVPLAPVAGLIATLTMLEPDMGTTIVICSILVALLWVVGAPMKIFLALVATTLSLGGLLAVADTERLSRITSFMDPCSAQHRLADGFQACQGLQALGSGGVLGLGLGASREKWAGGLPNPYTDYVFAIVGEELGLVGSLTVLFLFAVLIFACVRIAQRTTDPFARLVTAGVTVWIAVQALVNMATVVGLVPITGIPLPLMSVGGSALVVLLISLGMLLSFARDEPGARKALAAKAVAKKRRRAGTAAARRAS